MHLAPIIRDLSIILSVAAVVTLIFERTKQPLVLGYIVAGMIVGPIIQDMPWIAGWAELGVVFLMFSLGLEFSFRKLTRVGITPVVTASIEVIFMLFLGFLTGKSLGWNFHDSLFLGAMLAISSTTIIIKTFDELQLKTKRFAELVFGILIVEDLVAILLLVGISTIAVNQTFSWSIMLSSTVQLILVVGSWFLVGYFVVPRFIKFVSASGNEEMLTILSVSLCLALVVLSAYFHYSVALGAFIMGSILAESSEAHRIEHLIKPLRDVFAAVFFVSVGMLMSPKIIMDNWQPVLIITCVTILGKTFSSILGALLSGESLKPAMQIGFSLSQIGEFSFIIAALGSSLKVTSDFLYPISVAVSVITTFTTPYFIRAAGPLADKVHQKLPAKVTRALTWYAGWIQEQKANSAQNLELGRLAFRWLLNGIVVTLIFILSFQFVPVFWEKTHYPLFWSQILAYGIAIVASAPFLWGMATMFTGFGDLSSVRGIFNTKSFVTLMSRLGTILWLDFLSLRFFEPVVALVLTLISVIGFFFLFYRRMEQSYRWFEKSFLATFEESHKDNKQRTIPSFAPWDAHLVRLNLHPCSHFVGKTLKNLELRSKYGLNILAIQRESQIIVNPRSHVTLYPLDELLVLATDDQIEQVRTFVEQPSEMTAYVGKGLDDYSLKNILIPANASCVGKSIRNAILREKFFVIVVGLERDQTRILNPDSGTILAENDILWVVGEIDSLLELEEYMHTLSSLSTPPHEETL